MPEAPKFLCDDMLGKLARWLRIIGQDVYYKNRLSNEELIEIAGRESRFVLTRDSRLAKTLSEKSIPHCIVTENYPAHQLKEVVENFQDRIRIRVFSRCSDCNVILEPASKEEIADKVPPFVFKTQTVFRRCPNCGRVFWAATHRTHVEEQLKYVLGELYDRLKENVWPEAKNSGIINKSRAEP
jgi:hypothetical protein